MEYEFPHMIWLRFYKSEDQQDPSKHLYMSRLVSNTKEARECIEFVKDQYGYMVVEADGYYSGIEPYCGAPEAEAVMAALDRTYHDYPRPLAEVDSCVLSEEFQDKVVRYLAAAKVLADQNSLRGDVFAQRDRIFGEDNDIQKCIDAIRSIKKA